jgi:hypothetical protein
MLQGGYPARFERKTEMVEKIESDLVLVNAKLLALDGINGDMSRQRSHYQRLIRECETIFRWPSSYVVQIDWG